jgi:plastocyanin
VISNPRLHDMNKLTALSIFAGATVVTAFTLPRVEPSATLTGRITLDPSAAEGTKVVYDGEKPEMKPIVIDAEKAKGCGTVDTADQSLLIGSGGGIANVVIAVEVAGAAVKAPEKPVVLDQKSCRYEPHVTVVPVGTTVEFANSDTIGHNVHTYPGKNDPFNETVAPGSKAARKLDKEDRIEVKCDIHPWMNSWIIVANTNHYAVTGADGSFSIPGLPAGEHNAKLWHEKLGKADAKIKVGADGKCEPLEVKMGAKKEGGGRKR